MKKIALFTDIHFGAKSNSIQHNEDCLEFIDWMIDNIKQKGCDGVAFLGDFFEHRNSINILTLSYADRAVKKLNSLGIPIWFMIGNHDLYHRESRNIFSPKVFESLSNVKLISEITRVDEHGMLMVPYLFGTEYAALSKHTDLKYWLGHFEFKNFVVTGTDKRLDSGPDHSMFKEPQWILSGHFHKRQIQDNVIYIGNTFPTNYGDVFDDQRGMAILTLEDGDIEFLDWPDAPMYFRVKLSSLLEGSAKWPKKSRVKCEADIPLAFSDALVLKEEMMSAFELREFIIEEKEIDLEQQDSQIELSGNSIDDDIISLLKDGIQNINNIDSATIVQIYKSLS